jgi:Inner membrane component of T3SS, cytoplasmic domain
MRLRCSHCGAKQYVDEQRFVNGRPSEVACWMCTRPVRLDSPAANQAQPTIAIRRSVPDAKSADPRLKSLVHSDTASLALPRDKTINLVVVSGPSRGMKCELFRPLLTIGRLGGGADLEIDDPEVSRVHCAVEVRRDGVFLTDLRSTNGTYLSDTRVFGTRLDEMSIFRIGSSSLQLTFVSTAKPCRIET